MEQVSTILQFKTPPKYKDPGCPTITCIIGSQRVDQAFLDLGASVNLLPFSVYLQLGLRELKPTRVTLQLADRSVKVPRGIVEDDLVQVDKFYFPMDFIVLDTLPHQGSQPPIPFILGRPFLATSNAIINCRNGVMKLSFGNMTVGVTPCLTRVHHYKGILGNFFFSSSSRAVHKEQSSHASTGPTHMTVQLAIHTCTQDLNTRNDFKNLRMHTRVLN